jgi:hypothetical protein
MASLRSLNARLANRNIIKLQGQEATLVILPFKAIEVMEVKVENI